MTSPSARPPASQPRHCRRRPRAGRGGPCPEAAGPFALAPNSVRPAGSSSSNNPPGDADERRPSRAPYSRPPSPPSIDTPDDGQLASGVHFTDARLLPIWDKVRAGQRLDRADGLTLLETDDLLGVGRLA